MPLEEVITRGSEETDEGSSETATNTLRREDQKSVRQWLLVVTGRGVHVTASGEVSTF